ncbi:MAG: flagellar hook-associated protein FlgK [Proteobacteria bacterium]|nr:flagellar hook-associated protein FlgK [Pseudomonadota bacterium]
MSSLGLVGDIANSALAAQRYGIEVTSHNVANVNTPGYTRQSPIYETKLPASVGGLQLGRGVNTSAIRRISDQFIENQLMGQGSNLSSSEELESYIKVLEGRFSESSNASISAMLSDYWNLWQDISNNPTGSSERTAICEYSIQLTEQFNIVNSSMDQMEINLTNAISSGLGEVNQITSEIAKINAQSVGIEADGAANDLRDKRNELLSQLSEYIDVNSFEQENGTISVVTARGCVLVNGNSNNDLALGGVNGDNVKWQGSGGSTTDITDYITKGKLGGWLTMRDEIITKYQLDLDSMSKELVWAVNQQHSQGIGLSALSEVTGTYAVTDINEELTTIDSGLDFNSKISTGQFNLWVYDSSGTVVGGSATAITIDATTTLENLKSAIDSVDNISASITTGNFLKISADSEDYTFAFSEDTSNVLAALGVNTFFTGSTAGDISVSNAISSDINTIAAATVANDGTFASGDNGNAISIANIQNQSISISNWTCDRINGNTEGTATSTLEDYYHSMVGSIGTVSAGISNTKAFNQVIYSSMSDIRDSISAVSLDEEMTNLIKFQHAYSAAAKLISTADEMLQTLLGMK